MTRKIEYTISKEYEGKKIYEFLKVKGFSKQNLTDIKFNLPGSCVYLNNEHVLQNHILSENDILTVLIVENVNSPKIVPINIPIEIVYEDDDIVVVNKPADMPIHPSLNNYENSLANALMYYYNSKGENFIYRSINRLDRDTSGLTVVAKNIISANILHTEQKNGSFVKEYYAIVDDVNGDLPEFGTVNLPIGRKEESSIKRCIDHQNGATAITHFTLIRRIGSIGYVKLNLETGRTHQIRVHMKAIGHPLIGDFLYNPSSKLMNRQALHVGKIEFIHPITEERIVLSSDCPEDMKTVLNQ